MMLPTTPPMPSRRLQMPEHHEHAEESFPEQLKRLLIDNAFSFTIGWLVGRGYVIDLLSDIAGALT